VFGRHVLCEQSSFFCLNQQEHQKFTKTENLLARTAKQLIAAAKHMLTICNKRGFHVEGVMMDGEFVAPLKAESSHAQDGHLLQRCFSKQTCAGDQASDLWAHGTDTIDTSHAANHPRTQGNGGVHGGKHNNAFPAKGGVSVTLSPRDVLTGKRSDCKKHCCVTFGAHAQVHDEPTPSNSQFAWTSGAICLAPTSDLQGGSLFLHPTSGQKIAHRRWTELPMPKEAIACVDALGKAEDQSKLLTCHNCKGHLVGDHTEHTEIPGVEHKTK
jgi:hypothetical protein